MFINCLAPQATTQLSTANVNLDIPDFAVDLTPSELEEIALYTIQKINNYPKSFGKTVENYFNLLYPDEIKGYLMMRAINQKTFSRINASANVREGTFDGK